MEIKKKELRTVAIDIGDLEQIPPPGTATALSSAEACQAPCVVTQFEMEIRDGRVINIPAPYQGDAKKLRRYAKFYLELADAIEAG